MPATAAERRHRRYLFMFGHDRERMIKGKVVTFVSDLEAGQTKA